MDGVTVIAVLCAPAIVPDCGMMLNQLAEPAPVKVIGVDVRLEIAKVCGGSVAPGVEAGVRQPHVRRLDAHRDAPGFAERSYH